MESENSNTKDWKKKLASLEPGQLLEILNGYINPLKRKDNLLKAIHEIVLERLMERKAAPCACCRNALKYTQYEEVISDFPRIYLVIKTLEKERDAETDKWDKSYIQTRLITQFNILYQNHPKIKEAYDNEIMDKHGYLKYLESFAELIIRDSCESTVRNEVVISEIFADLMNMKLVRETLTMSDN